MRWRALASRLAGCLVVGASLIGLSHSHSHSHGQQPAAPTAGAAAAQAACTGPFVDIPKLGGVCGKALQRSQAFLGLPFAEPPTGARRWTTPQPAKPWHPATRPATSYGPNCMQVLNAGDPNPGAEVSEDCLTLNIYRPAEEIDPAKPAPVLLWLFGGGFTEGGGNETRLNGSFDVGLMERDHKEPWLVVTINYRLGIFGFLGGKQVRSKEDGTRYRPRRACADTRRLCRLCRVWRV